MMPEQPPIPTPASAPEPQAPKDTSSTDAVWTYRGYKMRGSEFNTAMVHFFRAEVSRANIWRTRLDATTNWAVVTTGAAVSIAFAETGNQVVILLNMLLVTMFLAIEGRRYRYYELWSSRVRLMETDFFAAMLVPPFQPSPDWAESLAENLLHPHFPISNAEAIGRRLRRNYLWIYGTLLIAWISKLILHPYVATNSQEILARASLGPIAGFFIFMYVFSFMAALVVLSVATVGLQQASGEVLPRFDEFANVEGGEGSEQAKRLNARAWFRHTKRRPQLLTLIITDKEKQVSDRILRDMHRGVTAMKGTGMYTGKDHSVLLCALTTTEIPHLKALVADEDTQALVIVTPASSIFGAGFIPLQSEE